ncbi:unnamed protein product, partial [Musa acuminata subsp. burmannicoides]
MLHHQINLDGRTRFSHQEFEGQSVEDHIPWLYEQKQEIMRQSVLAHSS